VSAPRCLVTGAAGFVGFHVARRLLGDGHEVLGVDNLVPYYDPALKGARLAQLSADPRFRFEHLELADSAATNALFRRERPALVIHLAAQAGVRYSLTNPHAYASANLVGFLNVLEGCRAIGAEHLVYASSSSVYGANEKVPFSVDDRVDHPISLYAATKKSNELMAHVYAHLYGIPTTGLRFFTVYGPWGRPDMAYFSFTQKILAGEPIQVFNDGDLERDFTYIDDIVEGVVRIADQRPQMSGPPRGQAPHSIYNIGNSQPVRLMAFIETLGRVLGIEPQLEMRPMQPGDVPATFADTSALEAAVGFKPQTPLEVGLRRFVEWYREYHNIPAPR
jgi:UDP-glucuronate 4-epimerase